MWKSVDFVCFPKGKEIGPLYDLVVRIYSDMICIKVAGNCETGEKGRSTVNFQGIRKTQVFFILKFGGEGSLGDSYSQGHIIYDTYGASGLSQNHTTRPQTLNV